MSDFRFSVPGAHPADIPPQLFQQAALGSFAKALQQLLDAGMPADTPVVISCVFPGVYNRQLGVRHIGMAIGADQQEGGRLIVNLLIPAPPGAYVPGAPGAVSDIPRGGAG